MDSTSWNLNLQPDYTPFYYNPAETLNVTVEIINNDVIRIQLKDGNNERFEVPVNIDTELLGMKTTNNLPPIIENKNGNVVIKRNTGEIVFDTSAGPIIFEDQFLQISSYLTSEYIYGIGETEHTRFKLYNNWYQQGTVET